MFLAIREWFAQKRSGKGGRKRRIAKLFLFEFVIVVLGVLVAQLLGEAISDSRQRQEARAAVGLAKAEASILLTLGQISEDTAPCLDDRLDSLLAAAMTQGPRPDVELAQPILPSVNITPWSDHLIGAVRDVYGGENVGRHANLVSQAETMARQNNAISRAWSRFELLNPEFGDLSASEREALRAAAIDLRRALRNRQLTIDSLRRNVADWDLENSEEYRANYFALADECGFASRTQAD